MNTKNIKKKLVLNKETVTDIDSKELESAQGGAGTYRSICINYSLFPQVCDTDNGFC